VDPQEADWEHENEVQDDDEDIGVANEEYDDDAHMRKKLGECGSTEPAVDAPSGIVLAASLLLLMLREKG
jgi:hypothetical protein